MTRHTIVAPATLEQHLESWAIIDCRFDLRDETWGLEHYIAGHIPGAAYASLSKELSGALTGRNGRHPLPTVDELARTIGRLGIDATTQVVVYDQDIGMFAARLWWTLRYLGHDAVAVLDGGWARWTAEHRPIRSGPEVPRARVFTASPRAHLLATLDDVKMASGAGGLLVDARAPERFEGRVESLDPAAGHIPGAINHFFRNNVTSEGTLRSPEALKTAYEHVLGGRAPRDAIVYCGSGVTACHNVLALEHAGLAGARLYVGSWSEWCSDPDRPVATGPAIG